MRQIRNSVFETNSSSSHSLVITTANEYYTKEEMMSNIYLRNDGTIRIWASDLEFYRSPFDMLTTFYDKARYAIAASNGSLVEDIQAIFCKYIDGFTNFVFDQRYKNYHDDEDEETVNNYGGTDDYLIEGWLKKYNVSLEEFLTNKRYVVICDGDEYCIWDHIKESGLIKTDMIISDSYRDYCNALREQWEKEIVEV